MEDVSIHELFARVRLHPDFAGGCVFSRSDVYDALYVDDPDAFAENSDAVERRFVTDNMLAVSEKVIEHFIFGGSFTWVEAMRENIEKEVV